MARSKSSGADYYVYALFRSAGGVNPDDIFYVGKGKGLRSQGHYLDAIAPADLSTPKLDEIRRFLPETALAHGAELDVIIERHTRIVAGELTEREAFVLEAALIKLLGPVGNMQSGHDAGGMWLPMREARHFLEAEPLEVRDVRSCDVPSFDGERLMIVVKATHVDDERPPIRTRTGKEAACGPWAEVVKESGVGPMRRGWDPLDPWEDGEARARAEASWRIDEQTAKALYGMACDKRVHVGLMVRDPRRGQTTVRYVWNVEPGRRWGRVASGGRWLLPLGEEITEHPWRGKSLVTDGSQILRGRSLGIAYATEL